MREHLDVAVLAARIACGRRSAGAGPPLAKAHGADAGPLSDRELTVLRYLTSHLTIKEIAAEIFVSTNTVKTHVKRIYIKLGVSSRMEALTEARRLGVL
jgi:LuxR family maltose regulon positive regulatory protein